MPIPVIPKASKTRNAPEQDRALVASRTLKMLRDLFRAEPAKLYNSPYNKRFDAPAKDYGSLYVAGNTPRNILTAEAREARFNNGGLWGRLQKWARPANEENLLKQWRTDKAATQMNIGADRYREEAKRR